MEGNATEVSGSTETPKQPPRRGLPATTRDLALASIGIVGVLGNDVQARVGAALSAVGALSRTCESGLNQPSTRYAGLTARRASVGGVHKGRPSKSKPPWPG
jgi:hypothetical protein